jgi:hypothetical protein
VTEDGVNGQVMTQTTVTVSVCRKGEQSAERESSGKSVAREGEDGRQ